jgi:hypothetical protein
MSEKHLLIILRNGKKNPHLSDNLREHWPNFPKYKSECLFQYLHPKKSKSDTKTDKQFKALVDSKYSDPQHKPEWVTIGRKLLFCIYHSVLCDFFKTASFYGLNPPLEYNSYNRFQIKL